MLKKHTKHTGHTQLQLDYHYKTILKNQRGKRTHWKRVRTPGGSWYPSHVLQSRAESQQYSLRSLYYYIVHIDVCTKLYLYTRCNISIEHKNFTILISSYKLRLKISVWECSDIPEPHCEFFILIGIRISQRRVNMLGRICGCRSSQEFISTIIRWAGEE